jgi:hypothetical protein
MLESAEIGASVFGESQQPFPKSVDGDGNDRGGETFLVSMRLAASQESAKTPEFRQELSHEVAQVVDGGPHGVTFGCRLDALGDQVVNDGNRFEQTAGLRLFGLKEPKPGRALHAENRTKQASFSDCEPCFEFRGCHREVVTFGAQRTSAGF